MKILKLQGPSDWDGLSAEIGGRKAPKEVVKGVLSDFEGAGALTCIVESNYIDRDFSAAYSAFYSGLFRPYLKHCRRVHFFSDDLIPHVGAGKSAQEVSDYIQSKSGDYLGFIVVRPIEHAPIGIAVISADKVFSAKTSEISVCAEYSVHLLGAELRVRGVPLTQQDTRVGACAQACIWTVGRHFHTRHRGPWYSLVDITELALKPMDSTTSQSLPAGSSFLTLDNMVRALRAMDRHPVVSVKPDKGVWSRPPAEVVYRYLDSGIPVILGLRGQGAAIGHAVVAVGREITPTPAAPIDAKPTLAEGVTHFYVCDDQRGPYKKLPVHESDRTSDYPWVLETDCEFMIIPLPAKVFMTAEVADVVARGYLRQVLPERGDILKAAGAPEPDAALVDADFEGQALADKVVSRTYLTFGWKYQARMLRNSVPDELKGNLLFFELPRYVWVTEFSKLEDSYADDPCVSRVQAHVVLDATGSRSEERRVGKEC